MRARGRKAQRPRQRRVHRPRTTRSSRCSGNFSFGDYFKDDADRFAWELVTDRAEGLRPGSGAALGHVYTDDDEAAKLWERHLPAPGRILRFGEKENFWAMGETGPCGPCSELHYYRAPT